MPSKVGASIPLLTDARRSKKARRTANALHAQLVAAGYGGGYSRLSDYIRQWRAERGGVQVGDAYVPLSFELGEAFQFDWGEEPLVIGGQYQRLQVVNGLELFPISGQRIFPAL